MARVRTEHSKALAREWSRANRARKALYNRTFQAKSTAAFMVGTKKRASEKRCSICKIVKPAKEFYLSNINPDGLHGWCKPCSDRRTTENARKRLGISPEEYEKRLRAQGNLCAICRKPPSRKEHSMDHNHLTGVVRGVLCHKCNLFLGLAGESIERLESAIAYLKSWEKVNQ